MAMSIECEVASRERDWKMNLLSEGEEAFLTPPAHAHDDDRMRVLLVEDDRSIADFVSAGLRQEGFAVDVADNGVDGLDLAQGSPTPPPSSTSCCLASMA